MPRHDPVPSPIPAPEPIGRRFRRIMGWMAALSLVIAAIAVLLVQQGDPQLHIHMLIATGLGVFLTMLLGTGLMSLVFLSHRSGHDSAAADFQDEQ